MGALLGAWFMMVVVVVGTISLKVDLLFVTVLCVLVRTKKHGRDGGSWDCDWVHASMLEDNLYTSTPRRARNGCRSVFGVRKHSRWPSFTPAMASMSRASTAVTPRYRPSSPGGRATPAGKFGEADPLGQRRLHDVETMLKDSNLKVDRLSSKLTGSHQEVQRLRTQLEAHDKDLVYQTRLAERVKREQVHLAPCRSLLLMLCSFAWALPTPHPSAPTLHRRHAALRSRSPCLPCAQTHVQADADAHREMAKRLEAKLSNTRAIVRPCADTYVPGPPYCTHWARVPACCVPYAPKARDSVPPGAHAQYMRRTSLGRAVPYRIPLHHRCSPEAATTAPRRLRSACSG